MTGLPGTQDRLSKAEGGKVIESSISGKGPEGKQARQLKNLTTFNEVLNDTALGDEVHRGEQEERLVRCTMVGDLGLPVPAPVSPKLCEHLKVLF